MKWNKDYTIIAVSYIIVVLFILLFDNVILNVFLVIGLFLLQVQQYLRVKHNLETERDISLKRLRNRLDKSKQEQNQLNDRFISLSQSFGSGLLMVDEDGLVQYSNMDMNNYFESDFNDLDYQNIQPKRLFEFVNEAYLIESTLQRQISYHGRSFDLISTPLFEDNMFKGAFILAHDITQINNAQEYQKRFTADVSHELKTPLSAIRGFSEILMRDGDMKQEDRDEFTELIHKESVRMETLLKDLSEISKLDRVDFELERNDTDIKELVKNTITLLSPLLEESKLSIHIKMEPCTLNIDASKISQVILNIVKNAISYTDEGHIMVQGYTEHNRYKIEISDTGIGINKEDYDKIFKRFYRVDAARSRDTGGSGLGLSISKNIILKHGGSISVISKPNKGSTFVITLPVKK